ncbi:MAG TPA: site-2 protease family protein [Bacteroidota bacterium]
MIEHLSIIPVLLFSIIIHEIAHGWVALRLGDPTAKMLGRLTLNPIPHIDPVGSVLIPLMSLAAAGSVFIAWAKPVPVDPGNFRRPRRDDILVSLAGPVSNLVLAVLCALAVLLVIPAARLLGESGGESVSQGALFLVRMFYGGAYLNIALALFNLLPVPPLDGSHVVASALPPAASLQFRRIGFLGVLALLFLMRVPAVAAAFHAAIMALFGPLQALMESGLT